MKTELQNTPSISIMGRATSTQIALFIKQLEDIVPNDSFSVSVLHAERYKLEPTITIKDMTMFYKIFNKTTSLWLCNKGMPDNHNPMNSWNRSFVLDNVKQAQSIIGREKEPKDYSILSYDDCPNNLILVDLRQKEIETNQLRIIYMMILNGEYAGMICHSGLKSNTVITPYHTITKQEVPLLEHAIKAAVDIVLPSNERVLK